MTPVAQTLATPPLAPLAADVVLSVRDLRTWFDTERGTVKSVDGVSFEVKRGETVAVVGESGSGKSVTSLSIMGLVATPPGRHAGGSILFSGKSGETIDLTTADARQMRAIRGNDISMIFQEPMTSLNPVYPVGDQIAEAIMLHQGRSRAEAWQAAIAMLKAVGISAPERRVSNFPHQMSGGMRQRVMIAMALCCRPALLIADEPTTALDVTIQAQILALIAELKRDTGTSVLFITHNLGVVAQIADRVVIMYGGRVVEQGTVKEVFTRPRHPYTRGLLNSVPGAWRRLGGTAGGRLEAIPGNVPSPFRLPPGCAFAPRCDRAMPLCSAGMPPLIAIEGDRTSRCLRWETL